MVPADVGLASCVSNVDCTAAACALLPVVTCTDMTVPEPSDDAAKPSETDDTGTPSEAATETASSASRVAS